MSLKPNVIANYIGQGWSAVMGLAFVPMYIKYIGIESYGLVGIFAMLQAWLTLLDMGMSPALGREMARFTGGAHDPISIWDLLRSIEIITIIIATSVGLGIWFASDYLANDWVKPEQLSVNSVATAFALMGLVTSLQFVETIYTGSIAGLQRQVTQNMVLAGMATVRGLGAVAILAWVSPTITAFFLWQALVSLARVLLFAWLVYRALPKPERRPRFSRPALHGVWKYAAGMMGTTILSLLLSQIDKLLLTNLLSLEAFGYYALAWVAATALLTLAYPAQGAYYPRFIELVTRNDQENLRRLYHQAAQLVSVLLGSAAAIIIAFSEEVLMVWTEDPVLTREVAPLLRVLTLGSLLSGMLKIPYVMQIAHGWTSLGVKVNAVAVAVLIPTILWIVPQYGAIGASWVWVILNAGHICIGLHFMYRKLLKTEKWKWYIVDVAIPLSVAGLVATICHELTPGYIGRASTLALIFCCSALVLLTTCLSAPHIRPAAISVAQRLFRHSTKT